MAKLRSERLRSHHSLAILIIMLCVLSTCVPFLYMSYQQYQLAHRKILELQALQSLSDLARKMDAERLPINQLLAGPASERLLARQELTQYQQVVDQQLQASILLLRSSDFDDLAVQLEEDMRHYLTEGRAAIDHYDRLPDQERNPQRLEFAVNEMFDAWDRSYRILKGILVDSKVVENEVANYYASVLVLSDLRTTAGRMTSSLMPYVAFNQPLPEKYVVRSFELQQQVQYLWKLIYDIQPKGQRTADFGQLHQEFHTYFASQVQPMIQQMVDDSHQGEAYHIDAVEITKTSVNIMGRVADLKHYMVQHRYDLAQQQKRQAQHAFAATLTTTILCMFAVLFTLIYARRRIFNPLLDAQQKILTLIQKHQPNKLQQRSLLEAVSDLQQIINQRDALEFRLKHMAHTDAMTNLANRLALDEYIGHLQQSPRHFKDVGLIVIDIDNFKHVNDQYGHLVGDEAIVYIANTLTEQVRGTDFVARYGGDEFLVIIEDLAFSDVLYMADQIRCAIGKAPMYSQELQQELAISISAGVAVGAASWKELLAKADHALLRVKANGKNGIYAEPKTQQSA